MKRREFLRAGAVAGVVSLSNPVTTLSRVTESAPASALRIPDSFELDEATIAGLQEGMKSGKFSAQTLAEKYLERIEDIDKKGPAINSVIEINPDALSIAQALDRERKDKGPRGPLHGIPLLIKDNIDTADRMRTTAGSLALLHSIPSQDSFVAKKL